MLHQQPERSLHNSNFLWLSFTLRVKPRLSLAFHNQAHVYIFNSITCLPPLPQYAPATLAFTLTFLPTELPLLSFASNPARHLVF